VLQHASAPARHTTLTYIPSIDFPPSPLYGPACLLHARRSPIIVLRATEPTRCPTCSFPLVFISFLTLGHGLHRVQILTVFYIHIDWPTLH